MAAATIHVMNLSKEKYQSVSDERQSHLNVGTGQDCSIKQLAELIGEVVGFKGRLVFDESKPDGAPRKLLDVSRINATGWKAQISLRDGLTRTYRWYEENYSKLKEEEQ